MFIILLNLSFNFSVPGMPPRTDMGSFEITENNANRDVYLYWQAIPQNQENGDNFTYKIIYVEENGQNATIKPDEITKTYAKFKGLSFSKYYFEIASTNAVGNNKDRAKIFVPSKSTSKYIDCLNTFTQFTHNVIIKS